LAREYGVLLDNRSLGTLVSRTFMQRTNRTTIITFGAYSAMNRQIARGKIEMFNRHEMLDIIIVDGKARGMCKKQYYRRN
jgi:succinate dehydrogenase / fumarate reductase flavoprotein subunit